jgi:hypothetical protein
MKENVGAADKIVRIVIGLVVLALGLIYESWLGLIGFIPLFTAVIKRCPAYKLFNISTCKKSSAGNE